VAVNKWPLTATSYLSRGWDLRLNTISNNRRQDRRISAPSVGVRIRKSGVGFHRWVNDPTLVNVSSSGISIISSNLRLNTLNKVEFELTLNGKTVSGSAIVCYVSNQGPKKKYGLLFIKANAEIDQLLNGPLLSAEQAKRLGEESAERFMQQIAQKQNPGPIDLELKKRNQLMLDAVTSMATRLGEMGLRIKDETGNELSPDKTLMITSEGGLSFPALTSSNEIDRFSVSSVQTEPESDPNKNAQNNIQDNNEYLYQLSSGDQIHNLVDLLDYICTCFEQIASPA